MAVPWGLVVFLFGIVYGYVTPGRQDKVGLFKTALLVGVVLGILFALVGFVVDLSPVGFASGQDVLGFIVSVVVLSLLFVIGAWIGDWLEGAVRTRPAP
ncbi:MAG TPA: hypothetical protein VM681_01600 [Candidatus Thermoplasmatota archaeon]|nr:hypothetical protein [Candidatus Thermoplasmatota archaeon]